jgi:hypothetical protein
MLAAEGVDPLPHVVVAGFYPAPEPALAEPEELTAAAYAPSDGQSAAPEDDLEPVAIAWTDPRPAARTAGPQPDPDLRGSPDEAAQPDAPAVAAAPPAYSSSPAYAATQYYAAPQPALGRADPSESGAWRAATDPLGG